MSNLDKNAEYVVLNYSHSPVVISTKDRGYLIPGRIGSEPTKFPLTLTELNYVNSVCDVFKIGTLFFEQEFEDELYTYLRIKDWKDILRDDDIDKIILNPTSESLTRVVKIKNHMYFDRIYGRFVHLKNTGAPISSITENVLKARKNELLHGKSNTEITIQASQIPAAQIAEQNDKIAEMAKQIETLQALVEQQTAALNAPTKSAAKAEPKVAVAKEKPVEKKTAARRTTRKKDEASSKEE